MKRLVCTLALALMATPLLAQVRVQDPWVRATVPGQKVTGAFMQLDSDRDVKLVAVRSSVAARAEVHEMAMDHDMMTMRAVSAIALPAGKSVQLGSGGLHLMLFDLKQEVKVGDTVPLTLVLEGKDGKRETLEVKAPVRPLNGGQDPHAGHAMHEAHGDDHSHHHQH